jgi:hypothetical protein
MKNRSNIKVFAAIESLITHTYIMGRILAHENGEMTMTERDRALLREFETFCRWLHENRDLPMLREIRRRYARKAN